MVTLGNFLNRHGQLANLTSFSRIYYVSFLTQVCRAYLVYIVYLEAKVLEELCRKDVFVYLGHGERARRTRSLQTHQCASRTLQVIGKVVP